MNYEVVEHIKPTTGVAMNSVIQLMLERMNTNSSDFGSQTEHGPLVTFTQIQRIEAELGYTLPDLLRTIYLEVGPQFNLLRLEDLFTAKTQQNKKHLEALGDDPVGLTYLVICDWGCSIYSCIDCSTPLYPVLVYDAVGGFFIPESSSFEEWVYAWINGATPFTRVMKEDQYSTFVNVVTEAQDLSIPQLLVLSEWINKLLDEKA